jgi:P4 family phage/plasmid primase-like protien
MALLTILPSKVSKGWKGDEESKEGCEEFITVDAYKALVHTYRKHDAHFVCYHVPGEAKIPRLRVKALKTLESAGIPVRFDFAALDIDFKPHSEYPPEGWHEEQYLLAKAAPWAEFCAFYATAKGLRLVAALDRSLDVVQFESFLGAWRNLAKSAGLPAPDIMRWNALYRFPKVLRDGELQDYSLLSFDESPPLSKPLSVDYLISLAKELAIEFSGVSELFEGEYDIWEEIASSKIAFVMPNIIEDGERNINLWRYACKLRNQSLGEKAILAELIRIDLERCVNPGQRTKDGMQKLEDLAKRAAQYDVPASLAVISGKRFGGSDPDAPRVVKEKPEKASFDSDGENEAVPAFLSNGISDSAKQNLRRTSLDNQPYFELYSEHTAAEWVTSELVEDPEDLGFWQGQFRRYCGDKGIWETLNRSALYRLISTVDGSPCYHGSNAQGQPRITRLSLSHKAATNILSVVEMMNCHREGVMGSGGRVFANGYARPTALGVELVEPHRELYATEAYDFDFDPYAETPLFDSFLETIMASADSEDRITLIWQMIGCSLLGMGTTFEKALILVGEGANGKSALLNVWRGLFDKSRVTSILPQDMENEYRVAMLADSLLNVVNEAPTKNMKDTAAVKAVISGEPIVGRQIRQSPFVVVSQALQVFACNGLPGFNDMSEGFDRRWIVLRMDAYIPEGQRNPNIHWDILRSERKAIICKAILAVVEVLANLQFTEPQSSNANKSVWRSFNDPVKLFLDDTCTFLSADAPSADCCAPNALYSFYRTWCKSNGYEAWTSHAFFARVVANGVGKGKSNGQRHYKVSVDMGKLL